MKRKESQKLEHFIVGLVWQDGDNRDVVLIFYKFQWSN